MTLTLISLGLWNEKSMTLEALKEAKKCSKLYSEQYTSRLFGCSATKLEQKIGKKIEILPRERVEDSKWLIAEAKKKKIGLLIVGDAMAATTHADFLIEAKKAKVSVRVIPGTSIYTVASGLAGLQIYKFGRATTLTFPDEKFPVRSHYDVIKYNKGVGLHTLVLLDIQNTKYMTANEGMKVLLELEKKNKEGVFKPDTKIVVVARAGSAKPKVKYGPVSKLVKMDFGGPLHTIIVPGKLHFREEEALELWE
ncbi:MAG: diphthine synthase [archaeon]